MNRHPYHPSSTFNRQTHHKWANAHDAPILDLSWRDDTSFATGSADKTIKLFDLAQPEPIQTFRVRVFGGTYAKQRGVRRKTQRVDWRIRRGVLSCMVTGCGCMDRSMDEW